jgi:hypothetical protein
VESILVQKRAGYLFQLDRKLEGKDEETRGSPNEKGGKGIIKKDTS